MSFFKRADCGPRLHTVLEMGSDVSLLKYIEVFPDDHIEMPLNHAKNRV